MENSKFNELKQYLLSLNEQGICLAFSGGVDSALLLYLCKDLNLFAVTAESVFQTNDEIKFTKDFCEKYGIKHKVIPFNPLEDKEISTNPKDRCYRCKKKIFTLIKQEAEKNGFKNVLDGTNYDDLGVYRPGLKALEELGVISPFAKVGITKQEIRLCAKAYGLDIYDKPSNPCAATRFPYNTELTEDGVNRVKEAEKILLDFGLDELRARVHGEVLRIEVKTKNFPLILEKQKEIASALKNLGYRYITLDLEGLRRGSMDN